MPATEQRKLDLEAGAVQLEQDSSTLLEPALTNKKPQRRSGFDGR